MTQLLLFSARSPDRCWVVVWILVRASHPLKTSQLLVGVDFIVVLVTLILLLFFLLSAFLGSCAFSARATLRRLLTLLHFLVALGCACVLLAQLLRSTVAANVRHRLQLLLLGEFLGLLLFLLELEAFGGSLKLGFVDDEEVARASLRKVWLSEDVLHAGDGADLALFVDVLELVHLVWLVYDPVAFLEVHQLVCLRSIEDVTELAIVATAALLALLGSPARV